MSDVSTSTTDVEPTSEVDPEEVEALRDELEQALYPAAVAAIAVASAPGPPDVPGPGLVNLIIPSLPILFLLALASMPRSAEKTRIERAGPPSPYSPAARLRATEIATTMLKYSTVHDDATPGVTPFTKDQTPFATGLARSTATSEAARASMDLAAQLSEDGPALMKAWVSRADQKVRHAHLKLHGKVVPLDRPFWRELGTGKELHYPGDPSAPLDMIINCRCALIYTYETLAPATRQTLTLDPDSPLPPAD